MEIKCTAHEKRAWFVAFNSSNTCPFEEDCPGVRGKSLPSCDDCIKSRIVWHITDPENDVDE